jgi:cytochrome bd-type quinol oxidase subunit 2
MMAGLNEIWEANETWLVLFGGVLFGAFPSVYALPGGTYLIARTQGEMHQSSRRWSLSAACTLSWCPPVIMLADAASSSATLVFMSVGIGMLICIMLVYNGYQYLVCRGKLVRYDDEN